MGPVVLGATTEVLGEETFGPRAELEAVLWPREAMALVLKEEVLVVYALLLHRGDNLLRFGLFDARVVRPLGYEYGNLDPVDEEQRRTRLQKLSRIQRPTFER